MRSFRKTEVGDNAVPVVSYETFFLFAFVSLDLSVFGSFVREGMIVLVFLFIIIAAVAAVVLLKIVVLKVASLRRSPSLPQRSL